MSKRISADELIQIFKRLDKDGNGEVTREELEKGLLAAGVHANSIQDGSGSLDKYELKAMFDEMGMPINLSVLEAWIDDHDVNGDGKLTYEEFLGFIAEQAD
ncbi:unnamed protein product [Echinostoma caproni]|uniref:Calmodulin n=1 Tax=Echinostoma caproni TaxID=27848 RepID=A0A183A4X9_9TREM|nr:unnamed protein product [Echinostoma caproni]